MIQAAILTGDFIASTRAAPQASDAAMAALQSAGQTIGKITGADCKYGQAYWPCDFSATTGNFGSWRMPNARSAWPSASPQLRGVIRLRFLRFCRGCSNGRAQASAAR